MRKFMLRKEIYLDAAWSFLFTLILGILPTWALVIILKIFQHPIDLNLFTQNGEFALYSASLASATLYISAKDYLPRFYSKSLRNQRYSFDIKGAVPFQSVFIFFASLILLVATIIFIAVIITKLPDARGLSLDVSFLSTASILLFLFASVLRYFTTAFDIAASPNYTDLEYLKDLKSGEDKLGNDLDRLRESK